MNYSLKEKLVVNEEFLNDLITKSWQEIEATQQQIASIDTSTPLGMEVVKLLKNTCTNYYVLVGCLESLAENPTIDVSENTEQNPAANLQELESCEELSVEQNKSYNTDEIITSDFEPFEYFVDFDEPSGSPLTDSDLYS